MEHGKQIEKLKPEDRNLVEEQSVAQDQVQS